MNRGRFYATGAIVAAAIFAFFIAWYAFASVGSSYGQAAQLMADTTVIPTVQSPAAVKTSEAAVTNTQLSSTTQVTGSPAIAPSIPDAPADEPAFTEQAVRDYAARYTTRGFFKIEAVGPDAQVISVKFDTLSVLEKELTTSLSGLGGPDTLLCLVRYSGPFEVSSPFGSSSFSQAVQIFDAHTGYLETELAMNDK